MRTNGAYAPEDLAPYTNDFGPGIWCSRECEFQILPCAQGEQREIFLLSLGEFQIVRLISEDSKGEELHLEKSIPFKFLIRNGQIVKITSKNQYMIPGSSDREGSVYIFGGECR